MVSVSLAQEKGRKGTWETQWAEENTGRGGGLRGREGELSEIPRGTGYPQHLWGQWQSLACPEV